MWTHLQHSAASNQAQLKHRARVKHNALRQWEDKHGSDVEQSITVSM
jgi:hypothetical protein